MTAVSCTVQYFIASQLISNQATKIAIGVEASFRDAEVTNMMIANKLAPYEHERRGRTIDRASGFEKLQKLVLLTQQIHSDKIN